MHNDLSQALTEERSNVALPLDLIVQRFPRLTELNIQNCPVGGSLMECIAELTFLHTLAMTITQTTNPSIFATICESCLNLRELTISDRYSDGHLNFEPLMLKAG